MMHIRTLIPFLSLAVCIHAQTPSTPAQPNQQRDLTVEKDRPAKPAAPAPSTAVKAPVIPRSYALVVGIAKYKNLSQNEQLVYPERDAESIYSTLISPEGGNFRAENVHKLIGSLATLANIRKELEQWLPSVSKNDDRVLIYFAGHGFIFGGHGYLAPYDFDKAHPESTGYPMDTLGKVVGTDIKGKWKVLLTDSCHSGAITPETKPELLNVTLQKLNPSLFSFTASRDREQSFETPDRGGGHGFFTYYIVKGMEGEADENGDGIITADELAEYVRRNVREDTGGKQNPTSDRGSFDSDMLIAYNPSGAKPGQAPPPKSGTLVFESNMDDVEVFVDDKSQGVMKKGTPLTLSGLQPGVHLVKAVKMGYEPDGPREEMVYPGQESTVRIRIMILRRRSKAATESFDKGIKFYTNGGKANYEKAAEQFSHALEIDPQYSTAAMYLGRTLHALDDPEKAEVAFNRAIQIDPDYVEAHSSYAGMLLDKGDVDKAIRELNIVTQREPDNAESFYLLAEAFRMKEAYDQSIGAARQAIRLAPNNGEAHFWLAESLRMTNKWDEAKSEYEQYLRLSNFDSKLAGKLNYYVLGYLIGAGKKTRASQSDIWADLRSLAYYGLCTCEKRLQHYDTALQWCQRSLTYDPKDPFIHYQLGLIYGYKAQSSNSLELLAAAGTHFRTTLQLNPNIEVAPQIKEMLKGVDAALAKP